LTVDTFAPIDLQLMKSLVTCVEQMNPEQRRDFGVRSVRLIQHLAALKPGWGPYERAALLASFEFRLRALIRLRDRPEYAAWGVRATKAGDPDMFHDLMIETAAVEPLRGEDDGGSFDLASFLRHALERAEAEGRG
jgi:hypothetical protein